jgi:hypothetical protein
MFLIDALRPRVVVELGTHYGVSYCAFCQAVKALNLDTRCYAIDTWQGDPQTGFYEASSVLPELKAHHDPLYGTFSSFIHSSFDVAAEYFSDGAIDLLHIDGCHRYEMVRHDFETWLPKLSPHGVVLFHDTNVREQDFGVWRLWEELRLRYPHFELLNGHGLGLLALGEPQPKPLQHLLELTPQELPRVRDFFFQTGRRWAERAESRDREQEHRATAVEKTALEQQLAELHQTLQVQAEELARLRTDLQEREIQVLQLHEAQVRAQPAQALFMPRIEQLELEAAEAARQHELELEQVKNQTAENEAQLARTAQRRETEWEHERARLVLAAQQRDAELGNQLRQARHKLSALQARRSVRWLRAASERFNGYDAWGEIDAAFQQLKDDSVLFGGRLVGFRLRPSPDLRDVAFVSYRLSPGRADLCGVSLALVLDVPLTAGQLGMELMSPDGKTILAQVTVPAAQLTEAAPVRCDFPPIAASARGRLQLRVFASDVDGPMSVFEWCSYSPLGCGPRRARAFCGLTFAEQPAGGSPAPEDKS